MADCWTIIRVNILIYTIKTSHLFLRVKQQECSGWKSSPLSSEKWHPFYSAQQCEMLLIRISDIMNVNCVIFLPWRLPKMDRVNWSMKKSMSVGSRAHEREHWDTGPTIKIKCRLLIYLFIKKNLCLFLKARETEHEWERGRERGRHRIRSSLQALSWCGFWTHRLQDHDLSQSRLLNWLSHPGAPQMSTF